MEHFSFGLSQCHGHSSWLVCEVALTWDNFVVHGVNSPLSYTVISSSLSHAVHKLGESLPILLSATYPKEKYSHPTNLSYASERSGRSAEGSHECLSHELRATLHLEDGPIRCARGLKSSLVIGQKVQIGPNSFTPRGRAGLVV